MHSMEDLKYAVERSEAETPEELIEYANGLYLTGDVHDAFVEGAGSAGEVVDREMKRWSEKFIDQMKDAEDREESQRFASMAVAIQRVREDLFENPEPISVDLSDKTEDGGTG